MRTLVTGAAGFIGFHVAKRLIERGEEVVGLDSINDYYDPSLKLDRLAQLGIGPEAAEWSRRVNSRENPTFSFVRASLEDSNAMRAVFDSGPFDRVCHLGAQAGVRYSIENPHAYVEANLVGFMNILEGCRRNSVSHLVYASSSSVYGLGSKHPYSTHGPVDHPISLYAATKRSNELLAHSYSHLYGLPMTGLRFFTVYGPWGRPDMAYFKFAMAMLENRPIDVYSQGSMRRDFTYIDDIVEGVLRVLGRAPKPNPAWDPAQPDPASSSAPFRVYNLGNSESVPLGLFIDELERALGMRAERRHLAIQPGDVLATEADVADLERDFGWRPRTPVQKGLEAFAAWFLARYSSDRAPAVKVNQVPKESDA